MSHQKIFSKSFVLLFFSNFFVFIGFEMLLPILPAYLVSMHATSIQVGLVTALFSVGAVIIRPYIGYYLIDNKRKTLAISAGTALLLVTLIYPFMGSVWLFLLFRFFHGIAWGVSTTVNSTIAVDLIPKKRLGEGMGYFSVSTTIGAIIAPSVGIFIYNAFSFDLLIWTSVLLSFLAVAALLFMHSPAPAKTEKTPFHFGKMIFEKDVWFPALLMVITTIPFGAVVTFLVLFGEQKDLEHIFLFFLVNAVVSTLIRPFTGKWYDKNGPWSVIIVSSILGFSSMIILSYANNTALLIIAAILFGAGYGTITPSLQTWAVQKVSAEKSGAANATFFSSFDIGVGASALLLGILANWIDLAVIFRVASICFIAVALLVLKDYIKEKQ